MAHIYVYTAHKPQGSEKALNSGAITLEGCIFLTKAYMPLASNEEGY